MESQSTPYLGKGGIDSSQKERETKLSVSKRGVKRMGRPVVVKQGNLAKEMAIRKERMRMEIKMSKLGGQKISCLVQWKIRIHRKINLAKN